MKEKEKKKQKREKSNKEKEENNNNNIFKARKGKENTKNPSVAPKEK